MVKNRRVSSIISGTCNTIRLRDVIITATSIIRHWSDHVLVSIPNRIYTAKDLTVCYTAIVFM